VPFPAPGSSPRVFKRMGTAAGSAIDRADVLATGHAVVSATGHAGVSRGLGLVRLCLSALNVQWPFSQLLLLGLKRKEARKYALGNRGINVGEEMWLLETRGDAGSDAKQLAQAEMSDEMIGPRPDKSHIIGTIMCSHSWPYCDRASSHGDVAAHRVKKGGRKYWSGEREMHGWSVRSVRALETLVPVGG